jgi:hypothetical protein
MRPFNPHLLTFVFLGINLACSGEGNSGTLKKKEAIPMNSTASRAGFALHSEDTGSFESDANGRKQFTIDVDVALTTVHFVAMEQDFKVDWQKGDSCDRIEVRETTGGLEVKHLDRDGSCGQSKIDVLVNENLSTSLNGGAGVLTIKETRKFLQSAEEINAVVMAGNIDSQDGRIDIQRHWSKSTAYYKGDKQTGLKLYLSLGAGNILFTN